MRSLVVICLLFALIGDPAVLEAAELGLAQAWLFEEGSGKTTVDAVSGAEGELLGSVDWTNDGQFGRALSFPGQGDSYVMIPHDAVLDAAPYTFTAWAKLDPGNWQYIVWKNGETWPESHMKRHFDIWVHIDGYPVAMWSEAEGADYARIDGVTQIADSSWHHVAKVFDGDTMTLYVDGVAEGELGGTQVAENGEDAMWIGARPGDVAATGMIDEVGFFTQGLSGVEVNQVMNDGLATFAAVEPSGKLTTTWGKIRSPQR